MNYKIIMDTDALQFFIDNVLKDLKEDECFYCSLFARKKYSPEMIWSNDKTQLKRFTATKSNLMHKIQQLEIQTGSYILGDRIAPQESLVLYIHPNPRSQKKAATILLKKLADLIGDDAKGYNVHQEALSAIQKATGKRYYIDFDFDIDKSKIPEIRDKISYFVNREAVTLIETRGGLHVLIETSKVTESFVKTFYQNISSLGSDVQGDCMLPVPGCMQGGFVPKIIS